MLVSLLKWLAVLQLLIPKLLVVSRTTFSPDLDLDVILGISPRTTTIDYDMADFDEQAFGPTYSSGTAKVRSPKGTTGNGTGNRGKSNMRKFLMIRPDSNDNVDGPVISDMDESNNQISAEDNIVIEDTTGTLNADVDTSLNADPDVDADGISTDDLKTKSDSMGSAEVTGKPTRSSGMSSGSKQKYGPLKQDKTTPSPTNNLTASEAKPSNLTFSPCFESNAPTSALNSDFCRFANAVYGVCKARFSSKCRGSRSSAKDQSFISSEEQMDEESHRFTSEESMDEENIGHSFESTDYGSLRASLESLGSADMSDNEMNQVLKIVKSLCTKVCSAAKRKRQPGVSNSESSIESTDASTESTESSAHSSVTQETSEEASEEVISFESDGTNSKGGRNRSKTTNSARNYKRKSPRKSKTNRKKKRPNYSRVNAERDYEDESDSD